MSTDREEQARLLEMAGREIVRWRSALESYRCCLNKIERDLSFFNEDMYVTDSAVAIVRRARAEYIDSLAPIKRQARDTSLTPDRIFSGQYSKPMWHDINAVKPGPEKDALYILACRVQELEDRLMRRERAE
jgi:hypothetical protein